MALKAGRYGVTKEQLRKIDEGGGGGGTTVVANPEGTATDDLEKLQVGEEIYNIPVADTSKCYKTTDDTEAAIVDDDYIPFLDSSAEEGAGASKKSTWLNFCSKIAAKFATVFNEYLGVSSIGTGLIVNNGELSASAAGVNYSTSEQNTGIKWVDGKYVYVKTVLFPSSITAPSSNSWVLTGYIDATIENIIDAKLLYDSTPGIFRYYPGIVSITSGDELEFMHFRNVQNISFLGFIIYYTKKSS